MITITIPGGLTLWIKEKIGTTRLLATAELQVALGLLAATMKYNTLSGTIGGVMVTTIVSSQKSSLASPAIFIPTWGTFTVEAQQLSAIMEVFLFLPRGCTSLNLQSREIEHDPFARAEFPLPPAG